MGATQLPLAEVIYRGPSLDDIELLPRLPQEVRAFLLEANGLIAFGGGLHVRGACRQPDRHSLRSAWEGPDALTTLYPTVAASDIPVAEDVFGDQFLLRDGIVHCLSAETGELGSEGESWSVFVQKLEKHGSEPLNLAAFDRYRATGGRVAPGQLLDVYPPFVAVAPPEGHSFKAISALERRRWLAELARQIRDVPDGSQIRFKIEP